MFQGLPSFEAKRFLLLSGRTKTWGSLEQAENFILVPAKHANCGMKRNNVFDILKIFTV